VSIVVKSPEELPERIDSSISCGVGAPPGTGEVTEGWRMQRMHNGTVLDKLLSAYGLGWPIDDDLMKLALIGFGAESEPRIASCGWRQTFLGMF
jgi:hypothetical protein